MICSQLSGQLNGIFFLGDSPNDEAEIKGYPFVGSDGHLLARCLRASGLTDPSNVGVGVYGSLPAETRRLLWERRAHSFSTVLDTHLPVGGLQVLCAPLKEAVQWPDEDRLSRIKDAGMLRPEHHHQLQRLARELVACRPNLVVTLGDLALWSLTGQCSTEEWRGATRLVGPSSPVMQLATEEQRAFLSSLKIFPLYPPERIFQQYRLLGVLIADLMKVKHEATFPEIRALPISIWLEPELADLDTFFLQHVRHADLVAIDIETAKGQIVCVQIGTSPTVALVLPYVDYRKSSRSYWSTEAEELAAWSWFAKVLKTKQPKKVRRPTGKLMQNGGAYDVFWMLDKVGLDVIDYRHDLRLVHHILQPEWPKSLAFMQLYTQMPKWKADVHHGGTAEKRDS